MTYQEKYRSKRISELMDFFSLLDDLKVTILEEEMKRQEDVTIDCELPINWYIERVNELKEEIKEFPTS